jgi:NodT family efflux transporter outer membrane factor (OMF) lipoprotein
MVAKKNIKVMNSYFKFLLPLVLLLNGCKVGPEYKKPETIVASSFMEGNINWKKASSNPEIDRGQWWVIFNDPILNDLITKVNLNNLDIKTAQAQFNSSFAMVESARSNFFPKINATHNSTSKKSNFRSSNASNDLSNHSLSLDSSWEADVWGSTRYSVEADFAAAKSQKANIAVQTLSAQSSLAQYYFELRGLDKIQQILDEIVNSNKKILELTKHNLKAEVMDQADLLNAENNLHNAIAESDNNKINRAQYQHAIAVLIGQSPSLFKLEPIKDYQNQNVLVPVSIPSELLERRPDIAQSEELVKQANANIGLAQTAFFPSISLNANLTMIGDGMGNLLSMPNFVWSVGPQMALQLFDGGARSAQVKAAKASYEATVSSYRSTVLNAFAEVEDQLSSLDSLTAQVNSLNKAADNGKRLYDISYEKYKVGILDYSQLLNKQIDYLNIRKSSTSTEILKRSSEIALIKALGGGWENKAF